VDREISDAKINLIASTDVKEYLSRKKALMAVCLFNRLMRAGIKNFKQLIMEKAYPRNETLEQVAKIITKEFPLKWENLVQENIECNDNVEINENIVLESGVVSIDNCVVKTIRTRLVKEKIDKQKFERVFAIEPHEGLNPFIISREVNHSMSQRIFKFRLLHLDIFTRQRMFKFKMTDSENCEICGETETIKHAIWDCIRAKEVWDIFKRMLGDLEINNEVTFESLFIGFKPTNAIVETMITRLTQSILSYDRSSHLGRQAIINILINYAQLNKSIKYKKNTKVEFITWNKILEWGARE
jgi:hypothetical protein